MASTVDNVFFLRNARHIMSRDVPKQLKQLRNRAGLTMQEMADALGYAWPSGYQRYEDPSLYKRDFLPLSFVRKLADVLVGQGDPPITQEEVYELSEVTPTHLWVEAGFGEAVDEPEDAIRLKQAAHLPMPVIGEVQAGIWKEVQETQDRLIDRLPITIDPSIPENAQYALKVRGDSMNLIAKDGAFVICHDIESGLFEPGFGQLVVVERVRDDMSIIELTVKRLSKDADKKPILVPESTDPLYQEAIPLHADESGDTVARVKAIVVAVFEHTSAHLTVPF